MLSDEILVFPTRKEKYTPEIVHYLVAALFISIVVSDLFSFESLEIWYDSLVVITRSSDSCHQQHYSRIQTADILL